MPTYQYSCTECGEQLEAVQKFSDAPLTVCEACGGRLRKVFSAVGIVFKGSGFYRTDSRNSAVAATSPASTSTEKSAEKTEKKSGEAGSASSASGSSADSSSSSSTSSPTPGSSSKSSEKVA